MYFSRLALLWVGFLFVICGVTVNAAWLDVSNLTTNTVTVSVGAGGGTWSNEFNFPAGAHGRLNTGDLVVGRVLIDGMQAGEDFALSSTLDQSLQVGFGGYSLVSLTEENTRFFWLGLTASLGCGLVSWSVRFVRRIVGSGSGSNEYV